MYTWHPHTPPPGPLHPHPNLTRPHPNPPLSRSVLSLRMDALVVFTTALSGAYFSYGAHPHPLHTHRHARTRTHTHTRARTCTPPKHAHTHTHTKAQYMTVRLKTSKLTVWGVMEEGGVVMRGWREWRSDGGGMRDRGRGLDNWNISHSKGTS